MHKVQLIIDNRTITLYNSINIYCLVDRPSLAVLQGGIATAVTDLPTHVPAVIPAPLSLHSDSLLTRSIWDQGYVVRFAFDHSIAIIQF